MSTLSKFTKEHIVVALANEVAGQELIEAIESGGGGGGGAVSSVNGQVGDVVITKSSISLGNVDNTSDVNKPVSSAVQTALNAKLSLSGGTMTGNINMESAGASTTVNGSLISHIGGFYIYGFVFAVPPGSAPFTVMDGATVLGTIDVDPITFMLTYSPSVIPPSPLPAAMVINQTPPLGGIGITSFDLRFADFYTPTNLKVTYAGSSSYNSILGLADGLLPRSAVNKQQLDNAITSHSSNPLAHPQYLNKGSMIWCLPGGQYATLQQAVDAASPGQIILLGEGSWGGATLKGKVDIVGLGSPRNTKIRVGALIFAPNSGSVTDNEISISNILIESPGSIGVTIDGSAPVRVSLNGCYIYKDSGFEDLVRVANPDMTSTTVRMDGCILNATNPSSVLLDVISGRYVRITNCEFYGGSRAVLASSGVTQIAFSVMETNSPGTVVSVANTGSIEAIGSCLIRNGTANGTGAYVDSGATLVVGTGTIFDIADGTGYCVSGSGVVIYDYISFNHIPVVQPRNTKFQNTLTVIPLPTTPTSAP